MKRDMWTKAAVASAMAIASAAVLAQPAAGPGPGPGTMRGYCGAPGAWGGGPGMMRGWGEGPGGPFPPLDLTADQQDKIAGIREDMRRKTWDTMGQLHAEQFKLRHLYMADKPDPTVIADRQRKIDELRRTMLKARIETANEVKAVLTKEQREHLRAFGPRWMEGDGDD